MGYRVEYEPVRKVRNMEKRICRVSALTALFLLLFFFLVFAYWPRGAQLITEAIIPGGTDGLAAALEAFADQLRQGEMLSKAFAAFCQSVTMEAQIAPD